MNYLEKLARVTFEDRAGSPEKRFLKLVVSEKHLKPWAKEVQRKFESELLANDKTRDVIDMLDAS